MLNYVREEKGLLTCSSYIKAQSYAEFRLTGKTQSMIHVFVDIYITKQAEEADIQLLSVLFTAIGLSQDIHSKLAHKRNSPSCYVQLQHL